MALFRSHPTNPKQPVPLQDKVVLVPPTFGMPLACPECAMTGYLVHLDLVGRTMTQACRACGISWETDEEAILNL